MRRAACEAQIAGHSIFHQAANMADIVPTEGIIDSALNLVDRMSLTVRNEFRSLAAPDLYSDDCIKSQHSRATM
jgi:hypothetical protein